MAEEAAKTEEAPAAAAASAGGSKLTMIISGLNLVLTFGIIAVLVISLKKQTPSRIEDIASEPAHGEEGAAHEGGEAAVGAQGGAHGEAPAKDEHGNPVAGAHGAEGEKAGSKAAYGKMIKLDQFTVNLSSVGSVNPRFARVDMSIEVPTDDTEDEFRQKMPQVRNTILDLFNSKKPQDLSTPEGRNDIKDEIRNALNSFLVTGKVKGVFFTSFHVTGS